jgi:hypothetical protein
MKDRIGEYYLRCSLGRPLYRFKFGLDEDGNLNFGFGTLTIGDNSNNEGTIIYIDKGRDGRIRGATTEQISLEKTEGIDDWEGIWKRKQ